MKKRGQISTEYLIVISFVTFIVLTVLGIAIFYSGQIRDTVKFDQLDKGAKKIVFAAETAFFDGAPAKATIDVYFPEGISDITIAENSIIYTVQSNSGDNVLAFPSKVPIQGTLTPSSGIKKVRVEAQSDSVLISETT